MKKTFVGFGFGPIQSGLFLYEAWKSGNFSRYVIAEVNPQLVSAVSHNGGAYELNIASPTGIAHQRIEGVELYNPADAESRAKIIDAISESDEIATSLPSVKFYDMGEETSVVKTLAEGLKQRDASKPVIVYASENNNHAAELLTEALAKYTAPEVLKNVQVLNTVIGKMSGVISDTDTIEKMQLHTITPETPQAILVEEFNRILISKIELDGFARGIDCFEEKTDLLPFEEAKLFGHNAIHSLIAYLADHQNYLTIADAGKDGKIMTIARNAFIDECGSALIKRYFDLGDSLFTPEGFDEYATDLLARMTNPNLHDLVERVGRDHLRKLGYDDRLFGTMRIAFANDITPVNLALGAAAGIISMITRRNELPTIPETLPQTADDLTRENLEALLLEIWPDDVDKTTAAPLIDLTWEALHVVKK
ncbi:MAG: hypothetical protein KAR11_05950, partial [Phycisphaerae bacterium]|nr:hypothetical protein [Phycisphaerae bacterium]